MLFINLVHWYFTTERFVKLGTIKHVVCNNISDFRIIALILLTTDAFDAIVLYFTFTLSVCPVTLLLI